MYAKGYFIKTPVVVSGGELKIVNSPAVDVRNVNYVAVCPKLETDELLQGDVKVILGASIADDDIDVSGGAYTTITESVVGSSKYYAPSVVDVRGIAYLNLIGIENVGTSGNLTVREVSWGKDWQD